MPFQSRLAGLLYPLERRFDRLAQRRRQKRDQVIAPYYGYETPNGVVLRGRILNHLRNSTPADGQSTFRNMREMASLFLTSEVAQVRVSTLDGKAEGLSDEEGYFSLLLVDDADRAEHVCVWLPDTPAGPVASLPVYRCNSAARYGVISDIDDTLLETGAYSLARNLWTTLTGNALTRKMFPDAVQLMSQLHDGVNPVFYVSSSAWNLYDFLQEVFRRHGMVPGPMFLRDLGLTETHLIKGSHGSHKGNAIDTILAANPDLPFLLMGDTGQHDAQVYLDAIGRHPGRIERVILRQPGGGPNDETIAAMQSIRAAGIKLDTAVNYTALLSDSKARS